MCAVSTSHWTVLNCVLNAILIRILEWPEQKPNGTQTGYSRMRSAAAHNDGLKDCLSDRTPGLPPVCACKALHFEC